MSAIDLREHLELVTALGAGALEPVALDGEDAINGIARFRVVAYAASVPVDPAELLRTDAEALLVDSNGDVLRRFPGIVTRVRERVAKPGRAQLIELTIESPLGLLAHTTDRRLFVELDAKEILEKVLAELGLSGAKVKTSITGALAKREMCTQLDETSLAFVERLLAEEGIFHFLDVSATRPSSSSPTPPRRTSISAPRSSSSGAAAPSAAWGCSRRPAARASASARSRCAIRTSRSQPSI